MEYAPIVVFVYKRLEQTKKTFESLMCNELAKESEVYIFSDGAKRETDKDAVNAVRSYIHNSQIKEAFKNVYIKEQKMNCGLAKSIISGVSQVITEKKRVIVVEDDIQTSPFFLKYMNDCLDFYQSNHKIWSISGYSPQLRSLKDYDKNVYLNYRASTWGWGTWLDRWETVDWDVKDYNKFKYNLKWRLRLCRGGNDMPSMLKAQMKGKIDSWGIRWCYSQSRKDMLAIAPRISLVRNIGFDGDGTHSKVADDERFKSNGLEREKKDWLIVNININKKICRDFYCLNSIPMWKRIYERMQEVGIRKIK